MGNGEGEGRGLLGTGSEQLRRQQLREITAEEELRGGGSARVPPQDTAGKYPGSRRELQDLRDASGGKKAKGPFLVIQRCPGCQGSAGAERALIYPGAGHLGTLESLAHPQSCLHVPERILETSVPPRKIPLDL